jgi:excisionase family DNA binding protein
MAQLLRLRQAARQLGVSPSKLYRAIADGRLPAQLGGGPGKPTLISVEALQAFGVSEGLIMHAPAPASGETEIASREALERLPVVGTMYVLQCGEYYKRGFQPSSDVYVSRLVILPALDRYVHL